MQIHYTQNDCLKNKNEGLYCPSLSTALPNMGIPCHDTGVWCGLLHTGNEPLLTS